jgi:hypothetical protein
LLTRYEVAVVIGDVFCVPGGIAVWVAVVGAEVGVGGAVEVAVEVLEEGLVGGGMVDGGRWLALTNSSAGLSSTISSPSRAKLSTLFSLEKSPPVTGF